MKKIVLVIVLLAIAGGLFYFSSQQRPASNPEQSTENRRPAPDAGTESNTLQGSQTSMGLDANGEGIEGEDDSLQEDVRPAAEKYKNAEEALAAVKAGALNYDDLILQQFSQPGEDCTWCGEFYKGVKDLLLAQDAKPEQKSYYAELLAISGRTENLQTLIDAAKGAQTQEEKDLYTEALELSVGGDAVVKFFGDQLKNAPGAMKDSVVAAITNQGSRLAAETLYKYTVEAGDPDGFYSQGIGLGELVPSDESIPYLQELAQKHDAYSHLAVKSMLNAGINGVRSVFDVLSNSKDAEGDQKMLKDAVDHVNYDQDTEDYLKKVAETSKQPHIRAFAQQILDEFKNIESESAAFEDAPDEQEQNMTPIEQGAPQ